MPGGRGFVRIVAGSLRGRRIPVPTDAGYRPTSDRAREGLFNILGQSLDGLRVVDAYAGSGALGLEALSRGAAHALFLERDPERAATLEALCASFGLGARSTVRIGRVLDWVRAGSDAPVDLILADPPYDSGEARALLKRVGQGALGGRLDADGTLVIERESGPPIDPRVRGLFGEPRIVRYGTNSFEIFTFCRSAEAPTEGG